MSESVEAEGEEERSDQATAKEEDKRRRAGEKVKGQPQPAFRQHCTIEPQRLHRLAIGDATYWHATSASAQC